MSTYTIKPNGYPFTVPVTVEQLKEYAEAVATSICNMIDRLDEVQAFYDEGATIGDFWPFQTWEGLDLYTPYLGDTITCDDVEQTIQAYIGSLELTVEQLLSKENKEAVLGSAIFEAITKS